MQPFTFQSRISTLRHQVRENLAVSMRTDLRVGITFAHVAAMAPQNSEKRERNLRNAQHAYDTIVHWLERIELSPADLDFMRQGLAQLRSELADLGVSV
jgi:deoxyribodipyrimidine photolyase